MSNKPTATVESKQHGWYDDEKDKRKK